jgi:N-acetylmuramoyl-L-alanine amidase
MLFNVCKTKKLPCLMIKRRLNISILFFLTVFYSSFSGAQLAPQYLSNAGVKTVVIDAGHGGKDPGAIGKILKEKDLVLSVSLMLGELIKRNFPDVKVIYTRDKDVFVELYQRAKIANSNNADLFISIHANAVESTSPYGTETFVLGLHKSEAQRQVAERENATIYLESDGGDKYKDFDMSPDAIIARQLMLGVYLNQSINFASMIQHEFKSLGRNDRGVKQAGLLVLYNTTMPAVLVELGFLSNVNEEKYMSTAAGKEKLTKSIFDAFVNYKSYIDGVEYMIKHDEVIGSDESKGVHNQDVSSNDIANPENVVFRVQIETSRVKLAKDNPRFKGQHVFEYLQDGLYKYTVGTYVNDFESANKLKNELRQKGFEFAFVVAFQGSERINLEKAIKLATK